MKKIDNKLKGCIRIRSVQASSVYAVTEKIKYKDKDGQWKESRLRIEKAVLSDSLFTQYMTKHGMTIHKDGTSDDFVVLKFDYGVSGKISSDGLRKMYYKNGCKIAWPKYKKSTGEAVIVKKPILYKMLMRSPGKAKEGQCIFVRDNLYDVAIKYLTMGLYQSMPKNNAKIVEMSAYQTLVTATAQAYIRIPMYKILILKDEEVKAKVPVWSVELQNKNCVVKRRDESDVSNILWDGMGLIDDEIFPSNMDGFIYCRSHFFKACLFRGNLQKFFRDQLQLTNEEYEKYTVKDMFGRRRKLKNIKVVTTENAIKWLKFADIMGNNLNHQNQDQKKLYKEAYKFYQTIMSKNGNWFAIVKSGHASEWGELQRSSYQINNSLPVSMDRDGDGKINEDTIKEKFTQIAQTSIDYCNKLKQDHSFFMTYLKQKANDYSINNVLIALDEYNDNFKDTDYFREKKRKLISALKQKMMMGKLLQEGDNLVICGNPIALLYKAIGQKYDNDTCFEVKRDVIQCYTSRFKADTYLAGFRSPHNSPNNIVYLENKYPEQLTTYFSHLGKNVIVINGIETDVQSRLNGQDLDSDSVYVTDQPQIVDAAKTAYLEYPTIINNIPLEGSSIYTNEPESYALMDNKISRAQMAIGYASNLAQIALSYYYDSKYQNNLESVELEDVFAICSVLAQCAIDSAKRIYAINVSDELNKIRNMPCMRTNCKTVTKRNKKGKEYKARIYRVPMFFYKNQSNYKDSVTEANFIPDTFKCPMQLLHDIIKDKVDRQLSSDICEIDDVLDKEDGDQKAKLAKKNSGKQIKKIQNIVKQYTQDLKKIDFKSEEYFIARCASFYGCMKEIHKYKINENTMYYLVCFAFDHSEICDNLLIVLFNYDRDLFLKSFAHQKKMKYVKKCPQNLRKT